MEAWYWGLTASGIITAAFGAVAVRLAMHLTETNQWSDNPLAVATVGLYLTRASSHGVRTMQLLEPLLGFSTLPGLTSHIEYSGTHTIAIDAVTAFAGVYTAGRYLRNSRRSQQVESEEPSRRTVRIEDPDSRGNPP